MFHKRTNVWNLRYAYSINSIATSKKELEKLANAVKIHTGSFGPKINEAKRNVMALDGIPNDI